MEVADGLELEVSVHSGLDEQRKKIGLDKHDPWSQVNAVVSAVQLIGTRNVEERFGETLEARSVEVDICTPGLDLLDREGGRGIAIIRVGVDMQDVGPLPGKRCGQNRLDEPCSANQHVALIRDCWEHGILDPR
ncbi:hypothetical protein OGATHE_003449 [Ogataea polymorpha]|uniref:Uncharacterized protein n=1 Tax=Ogataea polymorpha TaxID=460523 RepID=A0A9P8P4L8_9ASCO|nr:hypothetical protein OGATHE_003449 [Ogataea polymorpha]